MRKNTSEKKKSIERLNILVLSIVVFLFTACSDSLENSTDASPSVDVTVAESTPIPTLTPTVAPTLEPTESPAPEPAAEPTSEPTAAPTPEPTAGPTAAPTPEPTAAPLPDPTIEPTPEPVSDPAVTTDSNNNPDEFTYVLNTNTHKIHHPNCNSVSKIKPENYATTDKSIDELLNEGYTKCGNCW